MIIVLFHVICLFGKYVYQKYQCNKSNITSDEMQESEVTQSNSKDLFRMVDPTLNDDEDEDAERSSSLRFYPPAYIQRYSAVSDVLSDPKFQRKIRKVVDFGCSELGFINHLKNVPGIEEILCVDVDGLLLEVNKGKAEPLILEYINCRASPLVIEICKGSVTENDKKLEGVDAVVCIELIEHLYQDTLDDVPFNIFGYIRPQVAVITTPNADFNVLFPNFRGFRHYDHKFEWTRQQFEDWAKNILLRYPNYEVSFHGICYGPKGTEHLGACSQMAVFTKICDAQVNTVGVEGLYKTVALYEYPYKIDNRSDEQKIFDEAVYHIQKLSFQDGEIQSQVPLNKLVTILESFSVSLETLRTILEDGGRIVEDTENGPMVVVPEPSESSEFSGDDLNIDESSFTGDIDNYWDIGVGPLRGDIEQQTQQNLSVEDWDNNYWEEPSIIIPEQNYEAQDNTNLFEDPNNSYNSEQEPNHIEDYENSLGDSEMPYYPSDNIRDISTNPALPNILNPQNEDEPDRSLDYNASVSSNTENVDTRESSSVNDDSAIQRLNRMLDFQAYSTVSRSSTSPEPYLLQGVRADHMIGGNRSMSNEWMLNSTFHNLDVSAEEEFPKHDTISEEDEIIDEQFEKEGDIIHPPSINHHDLLSEPQFTSSPKISGKVALKGNKRKSLIYSKQCSSLKEESAEELDMAVRRLDTISLQHEDNVAQDSLNTIEDTDTSASIVTLDEQDSSIPESLDTCSSSSDKKRRLNSSEPDTSDVPLKCSSFDYALKNVPNQSKEEQVKAVICDTEDKIEDSYKSTKESPILSNALPFASNMKTSAALGNDVVACDSEHNNCKYKSKGTLLSPLQIIEDHGPEHSSTSAAIDSGYPNSASTQGTPSEFDLPSIEEDHPLGHKSPTVLEIYSPKAEVQGGSIEQGKGNMEPLQTCGDPREDNISDTNAGNSAKGAV